MDFFRRFMAGRYGSDPLNNALLILGIALIIVARILGWAWMNVFILALLCAVLFPHVLAQYSGAVCGK